VQKVYELGQEGVLFATFPETVVPYYPYFSFVQSANQIIAGREHLTAFFSPRERAARRA
jgi:aliphatic nitrilase